MSRVLKSSSVRLDQENAVNIEIMDMQAINEAAREVEKEAAAKAAEKEAEKQIVSMEVQARHMVINARKEADGIIKSAQFDAQVIIQNAKEQAESQAKIILQDSYEEGYNKGHEEGYQRGVDESESIKEEARNILEEAKRERAEMIASIEGDMIELVTSVLDKLLADTKAINPKIIINLIKQGLYSSNETGEVKVHVSYDDIDAVNDSKDEILSLLDTSAKIEIVKDTVLKKSDCIIETPFGNIDCSLDQQYEALRRDLYYIFNEHGGKA